MILELLISQYNEDEFIIKPMLDSIAIQQGVDFNDINVIIANDGSDVILSDNFLSHYKFNISYYKDKHRGLSGNRNFLLDSTGGEYIMFCDADDMFLRVDALNLIMSKIKQGEFDLLYSPFVVERINSTGDYFYFDFFECNVHGKVIRRQFLLDNNIRWNDKLVKHDSRYFFTLCENYVDKKSDRFIECKTPFYLWKYNKNSITKQNDNYFLKTWDYFNLSVECIVEELLNRRYYIAAA